MDQRVKRRKLESQLGGFTGTERWHHYSPQLFPNILLTDGVLFLANVGECFWLIDTIASLQRCDRIGTHEQLQHIQFWTLTVFEDNTAELICEWDRDQVVLTQAIDYTDFPLEQIQLYVARDEGYFIILLPSEY